MVEIGSLVTGALIGWMIGRDGRPTAMIVCGPGNDGMLPSIGLDPGFTVPAEPHHRTNTIVWPNTGSQGFLIAGLNEFDFEEGKFYPADYLSTGAVEQMGGKGIVESVHMHPHSGGAWSIEALGPEGDTGLSVAPSFMDHQHHVIRHMRMRRLRVWVNTAMAFFVQASDDPETAPIEPIGDVGPEKASGELTTTNDFVAAIMRPAIFNPRTASASTLSEARATADPHGLLVHSGRAINSLFLGRRGTTWVIHNTGSNDAVINLQGNMSGNPFRWVDDAETGPGITLPSGDALELETQGHFLFQRLRAESAVDDSETTLEIEVQGIVGVG